MPDPYAILGVEKKASDSDIKSAFRKRAKELHPDRNRKDPKAKERFAEINQAYDILGDREKRAQFDRGIIDGQGKARFSAPPNSEGFPDFGMFRGAGTARGFGERASTGSSFDEILSDILGGFGPSGNRDRGARQASTARQSTAGRATGGRATAGRATTKPVRGEDTHISAKIPLETLVSNKKIRVEIPNGQRLDINIPRGAGAGEKIRLKGQGGAGKNSGRRGDLIVELKFAPHKLFTASGADLKMDLPLALYEAVLGTRIKIPTLHGPVHLTLPPNIAPSQVMRLKEKGLPKKTGEYGDLLVSVKIELPNGGDGELTALMKEWSKNKNYKVRGPEFE